MDILNLLHSSGQSECLDCPQSYYCGLEGAVDPVICPPGSYCPVRTVHPEPCPRGTYNPLEGLSKETQCTPCTAGKLANMILTHAVLGIKYFKVRQNVAEILPVST